jgi:hypothetical protein
MSSEQRPLNIYIPPEKPEGISDEEWQRIMKLSDLDRLILARATSEAENLPTAFTTTLQ